MDEISILFICFCSFDLFCPLLDKDTLIENLYFALSCPINSVLFKPVCFYLLYIILRLLLLLIIIHFTVLLLYIFFLQTQWVSYSTIIFVIDHNPQLTVKLHN